MSRAPSNESFYEGELVGLAVPNDQEWKRIDEIGRCSTTTAQREAIIATLNDFIEAFTRETRACAVPMVRVRLDDLRGSASKFSQALGDFMVNGDVGPAERHARELAREHCEAIDLERLHDETNRLLLLLADAVARTTGSTGRETSAALNHCVCTLRALYSAAGGLHAGATRKNKATEQPPLVVRWLVELFQLVPAIGAGDAPYHNAATLAGCGRPPKETATKHKVPTPKGKKSKSRKGKPLKTRPNRHRIGGDND